MKLADDTPAEEHIGGRDLTDVIFAWLLGGAWLTLVITSHRLFLTIRRAEPPRGVGEAD